MTMGKDFEIDLDALYEPPFIVDDTHAR